MAFIDDLQILIRDSPEQLDEIAYWLHVMLFHIVGSNTEIDHTNNTITNLNNLKQLANDNKRIKKCY